MPIFAICKLFNELFAVRRTGAKKDLKGRKRRRGGLMRSALSGASSDDVRSYVASIARAYRIGGIPTWRVKAVLNVLAEA